MYITPAKASHPGFDSGVEICRRSGDVVMGFLRHEHAGEGADCFGGPPLVIAAVHEDGELGIMYEFGWRWSPSAGRNVLAWWYGPDEVDCETPVGYGPVLI